MQNASAPTTNSFRKPGRRLAALVCATAALAVAAPAAASAEAPFGAATAPVSANFARPVAKVVGNQALVQLHCAGSRLGVCSGTISVAAAGARHQVPFSVLGGTSDSVAVPVARGALDSGRGIAVARTAQPAGGFAQATEVLRLR
ncbi:MAG TPA: hypothetical protein VHA54_11785 [Solirubrobacterales bacterium]|nr:hypothetical protein [Solirubrobacterales bacterium]